jgi:GNAT superfamily N-acetyltransferase
MTNIRPFEQTEADYQALVDLEKAIWPENHPSVAEWQHYDSTIEPRYFWERWMIDGDDGLIAYGNCSETWWSYRPGKYRVDVWVHPDFERQGLGTKIYDHLMERLAARDLKPNWLTSNARDTKPQAIRFLEKRDYQAVMRWVSSELQLTNVNPAAYEPLFQKLEQTGIQVKTVAELSQTDANWQRKIYDLDWACAQDEPQPDALTQEPLEKYVKQYFEGPSFWPEGWFIAVANDEHYVGLTALEKNDDEPEKLGSGFTGVLRDYRRRGVATALKVRAIQLAQTVGAASIKTGNEENNPMYQLNLSLGFEPLYSLLAFEKRDGDTGTAA